jgi:hypothetical protein
VNGKPRRSTDVPYRVHVGGHRQCFPASDAPPGPDLDRIVGTPPQGKGHLFSMSIENTRDNRLTRNLGSHWLWAIQLPVS